MNSYGWFVFFLCLTIFTGLILFLGVLIYQIFKLTKKTIVGGLEDEKIIEEKKREKEKKENKILLFIEKAISFIVVFVVAGSFIFSITVKFLSNDTPNGKSTPQVVLSESMSYKNSKNQYLFENNLNDQIDRFDFIIIHKLPDEFDLQLYDIVVYKHENRTLVIQRIVGIEEPNNKHPEERYFLLKGDANTANDSFPVKYEQMVGIYTGDKVEHIGSFVVFLQSPPGWLCVIFVVFMIFFVPFVEKLIQIEKDKRYRLITNDYALESVYYKKVIYKKNQLKYLSTKLLRTTIQVKSIPLVGMEKIKRIILKRKNNN